MKSKRGGGSRRSAAAAASEVVRRFDGLDGEALALLRAAEEALATLAHPVVAPRRWRLEGKQAQLVVSVGVAKWAARSAVPGSAELAEGVCSLADLVRSAHEAGLAGLELEPETVSIEWFKQDN